MPTVRSLVSTNVEDFGAAGGGGFLASNVGIAHAAVWSVDGTEVPGDEYELTSFVEGLSAGDVYLCQELTFTLIGPWEGIPSGAWRLDLERDGAWAEVGEVVLTEAFPMLERRFWLFVPANEWNYFDGESHWRLVCVASPAEPFKLLWNTSACVWKVVESS